MRALTNGRIYTGDGWVRALLIDDDGRVAATGTTDTGWPDVPRTDLQQRITLPGFIDAHLHLTHLAVRAHAMVFNGRESPSEITRALRKRTGQVAVGNWILGYGYDDTRWPAGSAHRGVLDKAAPANPVFLQRKDLHSGWANTLALTRAGIDEELAVDPAGGRFERDAEGQLTGILKESARRQMLDAIPKPTGVELELQLLETLQQLRRLGLTTVCTIGDQEEFTLLRKIQARGALPLRVCQFLYADHLGALREEGRQSGSGDERLWFGGVKFFADGSLGSRTALLDDPYATSPDRGIATIDPDALRRDVKAANAAGVAVAIHAIGDRALTVALDAIEAAQPDRPGLDVLAVRNRIEHVQLGRPDRFARMARLQVIASMQPAHAPADRVLAEREWGTRCRYAYAWRSLLDAGVVLAFGSDAPVESADPLVGLRAAMSRQDATGQPPGGWYPEERLSPPQALRGYGPGSARAVGRSDRLGALRVGAWADLVVLDGDPTGARTAVEATYLGGRSLAEGDLAVTSP